MIQIPIIIYLACCLIVVACEVFTCIELYPGLLSLGHPVLAKYILPVVVAIGGTYVMYKIPDYFDEENGGIPK